MPPHALLRHHAVLQSNILLLCLLGFGNRLIYKPLPKTNIVLPGWHMNCTVSPASQTPTKPPDVFISGGLFDCRPYLLDRLQDSTSWVAAEPPVQAVKPAKAWSPMIMGMSTG